MLTAQRTGDYATSPLYGDNDNEYNERQRVRGDGNDERRMAQDMSNAIGKLVCLFFCFHNIFITNYFQPCHCCTTTTTTLCNKWRNVRRAQQTTTTTGRTGDNLPMKGMTNDEWPKIGIYWYVLVFFTIFLLLNFWYYNLSHVTTIWQDDHVGI